MFNESFGRRTMNGGDETGTPEIHVHDAVRFTSPPEGPVIARFGHAAIPVDGFIRTVLVPTSERCEPASVSDIWHSSCCPEMGTTSKPRAPHPTHHI